VRARSFSPWSPSSVSLTTAVTRRRLVEVKDMADRIIAMRTALYDLLVELGSKKEWGHIKSQIGSFSVLLCLLWSLSLMLFPHL
jgi:aspartate/tyrosine/aromatic aminotransferase